MPRKDRLIRPAGISYERALEIALGASVPLPEEQPRDELNENIIRLHRQGKNDVTISEELGVGRTLVGNRRRRLGLPALHSRDKPLRPRKKAKQVLGEESRLLNESIREMHAEGMSDARIAETLGRGVHMIRMRRVHLGLPINAVTRAYSRAANAIESAERDRLVTAMHADGKYDAEIAAALGVHGNSVRLRRKALGLASHPPKSKVPDPLRRKRFIRLHKQGLTDRQIAERLGETYDEASKYRYHLGLPVNSARNLKKKP